MKKNISYLKDYECYGCSACQHSCGAKAVSMKQNREGFWYPVVDEALCVECGRCEKVCPAINGKQTENTENPDTYALWAEDSVRMSGSASGGAFVLLAEQVLKEGGVVCGVVMDEEFQVYHTIADTREGIEPIRGSKYVQSDLRQVFPEIRAYLREGRKVLFTGTPCQAAGLKNYIGKEDANLLLVDLVCHGPTSQLVFDRYLEENFGKKNVESFSFRPKDYGHIGLMNKTCLKNGQVYVGHKDYDSLQIGLNQNLCLRKTCANCVYAQVPRIGDFTMGDFWGVGDYKKELKSELGVSVLLVNNEKAAAMVERIAEKCKLFEKTPLSAATHKNRFGARGSVHPGRERFFAMLSYTNMNKAVKYAQEDRYDVGVAGVYNNLAEEGAYMALEQIFHSMGLSVQKIAVNEAGDLSRYNLSCDAFVTAPQDVWGRQIKKEHKKNLLLDFARDEKKKVTIGTWCTEPPKDADKLVTGELLKRFDAVSTLDKGSMDLGGTETEADGGQQILDPILLTDESIWDDLAEQKELEANAYLFNYLTVPTQEKIQGAEALAEKLHLKVIHVLEGSLKEETEMSGEIRKDPTISKWIGYIKNSSYLVTDTPHAVSLAISFQKPFAFCRRRKKDGKALQSFLKMLNLENRMALEPIELAKLPVLAENIDYSVVNPLLESRKKQSLEWIRNAMFAEKKGNVYQAFDSRLTAVKAGEGLGVTMKGSGTLKKKIDLIRKKLNFNGNR